MIKRLICIYALVASTHDLIALQTAASPKNKAISDSRLLKPVVTQPERKRIAHTQRDEKVHAQTVYDRWNHIKTSDFSTFLLRHKLNKFIHTENYGKLFRVAKKYLAKTYTGDKREVETTTSDAYQEAILKIQKILKEFKVPNEMIASKSFLILTKMIELLNNPFDVLPNDLKKHIGSKKVILLDLEQKLKEEFAKNKPYKLKAREWNAIQAILQDQQCNSFVEWVLGAIPLKDRQITKESDELIMALGYIITDINKRVAEDLGEEFKNHELYKVTYFAQYLTMKILMPYDRAIGITKAIVEILKKNKDVAEGETRTIKLPKPAPEKTLAAPVVQASQAPLNAISAQSQLAQVEPEPAASSAPVHNSGSISVQVDRPAEKIPVQQKDHEASANGNTTKQDEIIITIPEQTTLATSFRSAIAQFLHNKKLVAVTICAATCVACAAIYYYHFGIQKKNFNELKQLIQSRIANYRARAA